MNGDIGRIGVWNPIGIIRQFIETGSRCKSLAEAGLETESLTHSNGNELRKVDSASGAESGAGGARTDKVAWLVVWLDKLPDAVLDSVVALVDRAIGERGPVVLTGVETGHAVDAQF